MVELVKTAKPLINRILKALGSIWFLGFVWFLIFDQTINVPHANKIELDLIEVFNSIAPLSGTGTAYTDKLVKGSYVVFGSRYKTDLDYDVIKNHYDYLLIKNGWKLISDKPVIEWGRDFGGREIIYCKGSYHATIRYAGEKKTDQDWTYLFDLTWNVDNQSCY